MALTTPTTTARPTTAPDTREVIRPSGVATASTANNAGTRAMATGHTWAEPARARAMAPTTGLSRPVLGRTAVTMAPTAQRPATTARVMTVAVWRAPTAHPAQPMAARLNATPRTGHGVVVVGA